LSRAYPTNASEEKQRRKQLVSEGINLILSLFITVGQQRLFPRTIMTKNSNGQVVVHTKEQTLDITSSVYCLEYFSKPFLGLICLRILNALASWDMSVVGEKNKSPIMTKEPACVHDERRE
jgi:hypothetical protein